MNNTRVGDPDVRRQRSTGMTWILLAFPVSVGLWHGE